ncbi:LANO_0F10308g1_1 [Lachancea nothofagi CBS 11611]|uniref:Regulator of rDNA transcription protein 5 n=1 Tax=Lachancea nothofagi CBS 11611 TaxID=1266666 RepID=A0A1G4KAI8_9SACH|nr:LANO_0F10308g1_1 [Lachancea nothofagi CBS 11611]
MTAEAITERISMEPDNLEIPAPAEVKRIYISNLDFSTTEEELKHFLLDYNVLTVLIPSQTIRGFRNSSMRPLGIGYADFGTAEDAQNAVTNLNGQKLNDRILKIKVYVPFSAAAAKNNRKDRKLSKRKDSTSRVVEPREQTTETDPANAEADPGQLIGDETTAVPVSNLQKSDLEPVSSDTVYCAYLPSNVTDVELREFFIDYDPQDIYVYRSNVSRRRIHLHRRFTAALVTLGAPDSLDNALSQLSPQKFMGKKISLRPARLSKIQEVKLAAAKKLELEQAQARKKSIAEATKVIAENQELEAAEEGS